MQPAPLLALALIASAASSPEEPLAPCVRRLPDGWREPATLPALLECQSRWRAEYSAAWQARAGSPPPAERLDKLDGFQRGEVREYLARHPDRAATDDAPAAAAARPEPAARAPEVRANAGIRCPTGAPGTAARYGGAFGKQWERTRGATARNAAGLDPGLAAGLQALGESLAADSNGGELGLTPGGADRVLGFLDCAQGGTTPEMRRLLQMLAADGGNLTDPTMKELKGAARAADANGLDLGMDPKLQRWMLDPGTDPASPQPAYPAMN